MNALAGPLYIVTGVLLVAGVAKLWRPSATAFALRALHIPAPLQTTRAMGLAEVIVAAAAIATGSAILWAGVAVAYAAFTVFIMWALRRGDIVGSCGCFGREDTPPTPGHAAFNAVGVALAALAVADPVTLSQFDGSTVEAVLLVMLVGIGVALAIAALTALPRMLALARGTAPPSVATFTLDSPQGRR